MRRAAWMLVLVGCGGDDSGERLERDVRDAADETSEIGLDLEIGTETAGEIEDDVEVLDEVEVVLPDELLASDYCETIVESFCAYYVRCGRMAVADVASCRPVFLETCNARYEPLWGTLAADARLTLSRAGVAACEAHLADVSCEQQQNDLDWGCADVWRGEVAAGGACGPGLESFVCAEGTTCIIDLDFCGECVPLAAPGETCDLEHRCEPTADCVEGACIDRKKVGEACAETDATVCVLGAACIEGFCRADAYVGIGDACDLDHRCPYKSICQGTCRETAVNGGTCGSHFECASGWCDDGTCVPLLVEGDACTTGAACTSGRCAAETGGCEGVAFACEP